MRTLSVVFTFYQTRRLYFYCKVFSRSKLRVWTYSILSYLYVGTTEENKVYMSVCGCVRSSPVEFVMDPKTEKWKVGTSDKINHRVK